MKKIKFLIFVLFCFICIDHIFAQSDDPTTWKYFKIKAKTEEDSLFLKFQVDCGIDPYLESYTITVDIRSSEPDNQYFFIGAKKDPNGYTAKWNTLSETVRKGLISWIKPNKIKVSE